VTSWHSYPKLYAIGHRALAELLLDDVVVEEKLDGSQFSFGKFPVPCSESIGDDSSLYYELKIRSKGVQMHPDAPEKMFNKAVETVKSIQHLLVPGWTYRAEYLSKPKHNTLAYDRAPKGFLAIFDINTAEEAYLSYSEKAAEAERLGLDVVPRIYYGKIESVEQFRAMLDRVSFLGGQKIEGVVVKNYSRFGLDKKVLMGKFVSESFKEAHSGEWKEANPGPSDIVGKLTAGLSTQARWMKAVQHLRERGALTDSPKDIGPLLKEIGVDVHAECADEIKEVLFKWAWPQIQRGVIRGFPEWYKNELLKRQFEQDDPTVIGADMAPLPETV
jgi:hypothetical protein